MHRPLSFALGVTLCIFAIALGVYLAPGEPGAGMSYEEMSARLPEVMADSLYRFNRFVYTIPVVLMMIGVGLIGIVLGFIRPAASQTALGRHG